MEKLLELSDKHRMMAYMEAAGKGVSEISEETGLSAGRVYGIRCEALYKTFLAEVRREVKERAIVKATNIVERYDEEAPRSLDTILELRDEAENESVRLKAAEHVIDRAPSAPKVVKVNEGGGDNILKIYLPAASVEGIEKALTDTGKEDLLDLLETSPGKFEPAEPAAPEETPPPDQDPLPESGPPETAPPAAVEYELPEIIEPERL